MPHPKKLYHLVSATPYPLFPEPYLPAQVCDSRRSFGLNDTSPIALSQGNLLPVLGISQASAAGVPNPK